MKRMTDRIREALDGWVPGENVDHDDQIAVLLTEAAVVLEDLVEEGDDYEVSLHNTFEADSPEDAVRQMVEWLAEPGVVGTTAYRVRTETTDHGIFDAEKL